MTETWTAKKQKQEYGLWEKKKLLRWKWIINFKLVWFTPLKKRNTLLGLRSNWVQQLLIYERLYVKIRPLEEPKTLISKTHTRRTLNEETKKEKKERDRKILKASLWWKVWLLKLSPRIRRNWLRMSCFWPSKRKLYIQCWKLAHYISMRFKSFVLLQYLFILFFLLSFSISLWKTETLFAVTDTVKQPVQCSPCNCEDPGSFLGVSYSH